jgi:hypothetical protein
MKSSFPTQRFKTLDHKLKRIVADPDCCDFILADAKDADMAFGLAAPGLRPAGTAGIGSYRSIDDYRDQIREIVRQGLVDIMLMSGSTGECLANDEGLFADSPVTPAVRMNDTTDIWLAAGTGSYAKQPALPFSTLTIPQAQYGRATAPTGGPPPAVDLGLFSLTLNDDASLDRDMLLAYKEFRLAAEQAGFRHFLEVFFPNALGRVPGRSSDEKPQNIARFLADHVVRALAGVPRAGRPVFLKIPYLGPEITEQLAAYDRSVVVGILGGGAGTTHDAFALVAEAKRHGARVALFGRKINAAEDQLTFVRLLRAVADDEVSPETAVREYHKELATMRIVPNRSLDDDLQRTSTCAAYGA